MGRKILVCEMCDCPVLDLETDFGPDGEHAACASLIRRMEQEFERQRLRTYPHDWWTVGW